MKALMLWLAVTLCACGALDMEAGAAGKGGAGGAGGIGQSAQDLHSASLTLSPLSGSNDIARQSSWTHFPTNAHLAVILGDYSSSNANASYVGLGAPSPVAFELLAVQAPNQTFCNSIQSIQSVTAQYRIHTAGANEQPFFVFFPPTSSSAIDIGCGVQPPWRPTGTVMECGSNMNSATHAAWTKQDIGCGISQFLVVGYGIGVSSAFVWEAMQLRVTATLFP